MLRGLCYAIVDEADSILIDDARVPLILAKQQDEKSGLANYVQAIAVARLLHQEQDFQISPTEPRVKLTDTGQQRLSDIISELSINWSTTELEQLVLLALRALFVLQRDKHYLLKK